MAKEKEEQQTEQKALAEDLRSLSREILDKIKGSVDGTLKKELGGRDFTQLLSTLEKLVKMTGEDAGDEWRRRLQDVFTASDAIDCLASGEAAKFKKWVFDRHKRKKKLTLGLS